MSSQMISRKSRRKTLSHAELEDFLCDLGPEAESEVVMGFDSYSNSGCDQSKMKVLEIDSDEQRVREYCKLIKRQDGSLIDPFACELGRQLTRNTNYKVLPSRTMFPEDFQHPPESIDAKRALLLSLSPMISDAEKQRQIDSKQCEDFTRCKVGKSKGRNSSFEYTDIDTEMLVATEEYEIRYLAHLLTLRATVVDKKVASLAATVNSPTLTFPSSSGSNGNLKKHNANLFNDSTNNKENRNLNRNINIDCSNINNQKNIITGESLSPQHNAVTKVLNISELVQKNKSIGNKRYDEIPLVVNKHNNENKPHDINIMEVMNLSNDDEIGDGINSSFSKRKPRASILLPMTPPKALSDSPSEFLITPPITPDSDSSPIVGSRGHVKHQVRRSTLSPATARFMMLEALAEEAAAAVAAPSPSKKSPSKYHPNSFTASSSSSPPNHYQPPQSASSPGKNLHAVASSLNFHVKNEDYCDPDDITGLPDLQFERDHVPNRISNDKIIVSDTGSVEVENGNSIEIDATEIDSVIKVDTDIAVNENTNTDNCIDIISQTMVNDSEKGEVKHIVPAIEVTDTVEQVDEIKLNSESFSTKSYSLSHCNLGDNIGDNGDDPVVLDSNIGGFVSDAVKGSSLSSSTSPPLLSVHNPLEVSISSSASKASISSYVCFSPSTELDPTSTDMILSTDNGGGRVIDIQNEIKEPVNLDCVPITETEELSLPTPLPFIVTHEEINAADIKPSNSDILLVSGVNDNVSGVNDNVMTYGDELDALLDISDSDMSASSSSCLSIHSSSRSSTGSTGEVSLASGPSPMKCLSKDAEESTPSLELLSNEGHRESHINEKLTEKSNDNEGTSYDSFDFIFDDSDPYSNDIEERGQRENMILTDDSDAQRALLTRALTMTTSVDNTDNLIQAVSHEMGDDVTMATSVDNTDNAIQAISHEMGDDAISTSTEPQQSLDEPTVLIAKESIGSGFSSLRNNLEEEQIDGGTSMILEDTTVGSSACSEVIRKDIIQSNVYEAKVEEMLESGYQCSGDSNTNNGLKIADSNDKEVIMLPDECEVSTVQNMAEIFPSSTNGENGPLNGGDLSDDAQEINMCSCDKEVDSIDISVDTMQVDEDSLEMERNLVRRRDGWSPDVESDPVKSPKKKSKNNGSIEVDNDDSENISICRTVIQDEEGLCDVDTEELGIFKTIVPELSAISSPSSSVSMTLNTIEESVSTTSLVPPEASFSVPQGTAMTLEEAERRALDRLSCRYETARWKYHWEMASFHAAKMARDSKSL